MIEQHTTSASSINWDILIFVRRHSPVKGMKIRRSVRTLKKTTGNRVRRFADTCISGRSPFPDSDDRNVCLVQKGQRTYRKVLSRPAQGILQRFCDSGKWGIVFRKTGNFQLRNHNRVHPIISGSSSRTRREEICPCDG